MKHHLEYYGTITMGPSSDEIKTEGKTDSHLNNLIFVWTHAGVTFCLLPILIFFFFKSTFFAFRSKNVLDT